MVSSSTRIASSSSTTRMRFSESLTFRRRASLLPLSAYAELIAFRRRERLRTARFREQLRHFPVERREVVRLAAADPRTVANAFRVLPDRAGVAQVIFQRRPARDDPSLGEPGRDEQPRPVTDHRNWLAGQIDLLHEPLRVLVDAN